MTSITKYFTNVISFTHIELNPVLIFYVVKGIYILLARILTYHTKKMKNMHYFKTALLQITVITAILSSTTSCDKKNVEEKRESIEEHNEMKSDSIANRKKEVTFLSEASEINMEEISLGKLAIEKAVGTDVKDMGKMMEMEHAKCLKGLVKLAEEKSIKIPTKLSDKAHKTYNQLNDKTGIAFDKAYCDLMVNGHKDAIVLFEKAVAECTDPDIKAWASETLPDLHRHLQHSLMCQKKAD